MLTLLAEHNVRQLFFLPRSASGGPDDVYLIHELRSLGCAVELVKVSVVNK